MWNVNELIHRHMIHSQEINKNCNITFYSLVCCENSMTAGLLPDISLLFSLIKYGFIDHKMFSNYID